MQALQASLARAEKRDMARAAASRLEEREKRAVEKQRAARDVAGATAASASSGVVARASKVRVQVLELKCEKLEAALRASNQSHSAAQQELGSQALVLASTREKLDLITLDHKSVVARAKVLEDEHTVLVTKAKDAKAELTERDKQLHEARTAHTAALVQCAAYKKQVEAVVAAANEEKAALEEAAAVEHAAVQAQLLDTCRKNKAAAQKQVADIRIELSSCQKTLAEAISENAKLKSSTATRALVPPTPSPSAAVRKGACTTDKVIRYSTEMLLGMRSSNTRRPARLPPLFEPNGSPIYVNKPDEAVHAGALSASATKGEGDESASASPSTRKNSRGGGRLKVYDKGTAPEGKGSWRKSS